MDWFWPNSDQLNDYPDPVGFDAEWIKWEADLADAPPVVAEIFAREYIQNSVDAIRTQKRLLAELGVDPGLKKFGINFRFVELSGERLEKFSAASGLGNLRTRYLQMSEDEKRSARLENSEWLSAISQPKSLRLLVCEEVGGVGMYGHWWTQGDINKTDSRLKLALIQTQSEKGSLVSGGSWGHGKKAIANASECRALFAYTCFIKREKTSENDSDITRRLTGVAYWKKHNYAQKVCQGLGIFGYLKDQNSVVWADNFMPLDEKIADDFIAKLGVNDVALRSANAPEQCGTSYIIVEPAFSAKDLARSIERNWWPLIEEDEVTISVTDDKGDDVEIAPQNQPALVPFIHAFGLLDTSTALERFEVREAIKVSHKNEGKLSSGTIALTSDTDPNGWSYSELEGAASLVCLIRGDMVIAYQPSPEKKRQIPFLRGVFIVDSEKNKKSAQILRLAEPHLHNSWQSKDERIVSPEDRKYAADLLDQIHLKVRELRKAIKGVRRPINAQFRAFTKIFTSGKAIVNPPPPPPPPTFRWISIQYPNGIKRISGSSADTLALLAECKIALRDTPKNPAPAQLKIRVTLSWSVQEETLKTDPALLDVSKDVIPKGFVTVDTGEYEGVIKRGQILTFGWHSQEFSIDWSVAPTPIVEKAE